MVFAINIHNYIEKSLRGSLGDRGNLYKKALSRWPLSSSLGAQILEALDTYIGQLLYKQIKFLPHFDQHLTTYRVVQTIYCLDCEATRSLFPIRVAG